MTADLYTDRVIWSAEDGEYVGLCVELPSLSWLAPSRAAALVGIRHLVADVVADGSLMGSPANACGSW